MNLDPGVYVLLLRGMCYYILCITHARRAGRVKTLFSFFHLDYLFRFYCCLSLPFHGAIPPPSRGIVGKNQSAWSKTTVRSNREFPLKVRRRPLVSRVKRTVQVLEVEWKKGHNLKENNKYLLLLKCYDRKMVKSLYSCVIFPLTQPQVANQQKNSG